MAAPAMPCGEEFQPEAAIVNYFGKGMICTFTFNQSTNAHKCIMSEVFSHAQVHE